MRVRKATHLALTLLVAAGIGVSGATAKAQGANSTKSPKPSGRPRHTKSARKTTPRERGQKAPDAQRISEIQSALAKDGSFNGKPSGKWDPSTIDAMKKFQEAHGLNPSGKLDAKTLQKLGFGSQTAGLAPPMPPVSSSSLAASPSSPVRRQQ